MTVESFLADAPATPDASNPAFAAFSDVFKHFNESADGLPTVDDGPAKGQVYYSDDEDEDEETVQRAQQRAMADAGMTRRERRQAAKLSVSELKQHVDRPEVVEWFDADARDPRLLVTLKAYRK
jgi:splicing factor 3B subunit 2